jgi:hypothetical protein
MIDIDGRMHADGRFNGINIEIRACGGLDNKGCRAVVFRHRNTRNGSGSFRDFLGVCLQGRDDTLPANF